MPENHSEQKQTEVEPQSTDVVNEADVNSEPVEMNAEDIWNAEGLDEKVAERLTKAKQMFEETSTKSTQYEREIQLIKDQYSQLTNDIKEAIANPDVYNAYRKQLGYEVADTSKQTASEMMNSLDFTNIKTPEDLAKSIQGYVDQKISDFQRQSEAMVQTRVEAIARPLSVERWNTASKQMTERFGPEYARSETKVFDMIRNGYYKPLLNSGLKESELLEKVYRAEFPDQISAWEKSKAVQKKQEVAKVSTEKPKQKHSKATPEGKDIESIIARVNARLGS